MKVFIPSLLLTRSYVALVMFSATCGGASTDDAEAFPPTASRSSNLRPAIAGSTSKADSNQLPGPPLVSLEGIERLIEMGISMQERIETLEAKNDALTERMVSIETRNDDLEQQLRATHEPAAFEEGVAASARQERRVLQQGVTLRAFNQLKNSVNEVRDRVACVRTGSNAETFILEGCDVHVRNGAGQTDSVNGRGNLIVGYNSLGPVAPVERARTGSHNLVVGDAHAWTSHSGVLAGTNHKSTEARTALVGGT